MNNTKKILSGLLALTMTAGLTACGGGDTGTADNGGAGDAAETTTAEVTTTTQVTVEANTEELKDDEVAVIENAMTQLQDVELENKEIKWLAHYTKNPGGDGQSKTVGLELFERKYGGKVIDYTTTWEERWDHLSKYVLGGEGIDFWPGDDTYNFPKGVVNGMFQPVDDYIDLNSPIWQNTKTAMETFNFGGKHFSLITNVTAEQVVIYDTTTLEANGLDDPWELYKEGNWNWDTFKQMLVDYVDVENEQYGLDGWYLEKSLYLSAGVPTVQSVDGQLVCNLSDPTVEKAQNFGYELFTNGLVMDLEQFEWNIQPQLMGEGKELFLLWGTWGISGDPSTWWCGIKPENVGIAPVPSPADSDPWQSATMAGYALLKGASNPQGVALFAECDIVANNDEGAIAVADRKKMDDSGWSEDLIAREKEINALAAKYPVYELATGCSQDIAAYTTEGGSNVGTRAAYHGTDWATTRESLADPIGLMVSEVNNELQAKIAEFN